MPHSVDKLLIDIRIACEEIQSFVQGQDFKKLKSNTSDEMRRNRIRVHLCSSVVKKCISRVLRHVRRSSIERRWKPLVRSGKLARSSYPLSYFCDFLCLFVAKKLRLEA